MKYALIILGVTLVGKPAIAADGAALYGAHCAMCHQTEAQGVPEQFPPLKQRIGQIALMPYGKTYLEHVLLNGLHGPIIAAEHPYSGVMPPMNSLPDDEIAAVLTYVTSLGTTLPATTFTANDIATARAAPVKVKEILAERRKLNAERSLP